MACSWLQTKVSEEKRLAVTIHSIDEEVSVVLRGAFLKRPNGLVQINRCFGGKFNVYHVLCISVLSVECCNVLCLNANG